MFDVETRVCMWITVNIILYYGVLCSLLCSLCDIVRYSGGGGGDVMLFHLAYVYNVWCALNLFAYIECV